MQYHFKDNDPFKQGASGKFKDLGEMVVISGEKDPFLSRGNSADFDDDDCDIGEEYDESAAGMKMSIRAMNFNPMQSTTQLSKAEASYFP